MFKFFVKQILILKQSFKKTIIKVFKSVYSQNLYFLKDKLNFR